MDKLFVIAVEGRELVALSASSGIELDREWVPFGDTASHVLACRVLVNRVFEGLEAEGYTRASL